VRALADALKIQDKEVRLRAVDALGKLGPAAVRALAENQDKSIRLRAVDALGKMGPAAVRTLADTAALNDLDEEVRQRAANALEKIQSPKPKANLPETEAQWNEPWIRPWWWSER